MAGVATEEAAICRLCWDEQQSDAGGQLLSPCSCTGSLRHIHRRCLYTWQQTILRQGGPRASLQCEICKHSYSIVPSATWLSPMDRAHHKALAAAGCQSMQDLVVRQLHHYAMMRAVVTGLTSALHPSLMGLKVGVALGCCMLLQRAVAAVAAVTRLRQPGRQGQGRGTAGSPAAEADSGAPKPLLVEALFAPITGLVLGGTWCFLRGFRRGYVGGLCTALGLAAKIATGGLGLLGRGLALLGRV